MTKTYSGKAISKPCSGQAHKPNVDQDHCMICMPGWGEIPYCPEHDTRIAENGWCDECSKYYERGKS